MGSGDIDNSVFNMAVSGHFSKWHPRPTRPGFEMSTYIILIKKPFFYPNQVRHNVLLELSAGLYVRERTM